jgi:hypothetical protein
LASGPRRLRMVYSPRRAPRLSRGLARLAPVVERGWLRVLSVHGVGACTGRVSALARIVKYDGPRPPWLGALLSAHRPDRAAAGIG